MGDLERMENDTGEQCYSLQAPATEVNVSSSGHTYFYCQNPEHMEDKHSHNVRLHHTRIDKDDRLEVACTKFLSLNECNYWVHHSYHYLWTDD
jgi:hypothetical protein